MIDAFIDSITGSVSGWSGIATTDNIGKAIAIIICAAIIIFFVRLLKSHPMLLLLIIGVMGILMLKGGGII